MSNSVRTAPEERGPTPSASPEAVTIAVIEDNRLVREGLCALLAKVPGFRVVAAGAEVGALGLRRARPRVVLLDLGLADEDSLEVAQHVKRECPDADVVVMDLLPAQEEIVEFVNAGVRGFIMKDATLEDLSGTIRSVARGSPVLPPQMAGALFSQIASDAVVVKNAAYDPRHNRMTPREREVVNLIAEGLSNKEIAARLHVSTHTVKSHVRNIMEKLALHTRLQIAAHVHSGQGGTA